MKVAVCISGAPRSGLSKRDLRKNYDMLVSNFPTADFYFGSWKGYEDTITKFYSDKDVWFFDEPQLDYHPFIDITIDNPTPKLSKMIKQSKDNPKFRETSTHQTKQILAHCYIVDRIEDYDVVIRVRYDTATYKGADFVPYIQDAYDNNRAIGFATLNPGSDSFSRTVEQRNNDYHNQFLFDQLIIHPKKLLDTKSVYRLHDEHRLVAAEHGWWQVLSGSNNHRCIAGWANPDKSVNSKFL